MTKSNLTAGLRVAVPEAPLSTEPADYLPIMGGWAAEPRGSRNTGPPGLRGEMNGLVLMKEFGTVGAICGSCLVALRMPVSGYGFVFYLLSSILWLWVAVLTQEWELAAMQGAFTIINVVGIVRWLGPKVRNQQP